MTGVEQFLDVDHSRVSGWSRHPASASPLCFTDV